MSHPLTAPYANPDARITQILEALRTTTPSAGLEQRITARLAQAAEARQSSAAQAHTHTTTDNSAAPSFFAVILTLTLNAVKRKGKAPRISLVKARPYTVAAILTLLLTLTTLTLHQRRVLHISILRCGHRACSATAPAHLNPAITLAETTPTAPTPASTPCLEGAGLQSRRNISPCSAALAAEGISHPADTQVPRDFSLGSHNASQRAGVLTPAPSQQPDPDTIALAETLAPSRPAPPLPLTSQERLLLAATRPGQPIQIAELDIARAPLLRAAAESRQQASIERYVKSLLVPFAVADALSPTTYSQPQETPTPAPPPSN